jgi:iron complex outermembrane recepter protein
MRSRPSLFETTSALLFFLFASGVASAQESSGQRTPAPREAFQQQAAPPTTEPAATAATPAPPAETGAPALRAGEEEILVTGSRVRRKDLTTPAPVTVLTRQQLEESGRVSIGEFLQLMPEQGNAPNFQLNTGGATYSADGSTRINLRSLGVPRTLVLVNGRRMVPAGVGASVGVDLNSIPAVAVDHIEVLKDGASAIYGSDAIAGVVNVITRRSFNATQATAQYGVSSKGDAQTFDASVTSGRTGDFGNFLFSAGYFNQGDSWLRDRSWSANALNYNYANGTTKPGGSLRTPQGTIALPPDANTSASCTTLCRNLIASDPSWATDNFIRDPSTPLGWRPITGADRYNFAAENYLTIPAQRIQAYSAGDTRLIAGVRAYYEASYVQRNSQTNAAPMPLNPSDYTLAGSNVPITYSKNSLYNPFGVDLPFAGRRLVEFGHREYKEDLGTFRVVTGVDGTLSDNFGPLRGWYWDTSINYGRTSGTFTTDGALRNSRVADAVGPSMMINGVPRCVRTPGDASTVIPDCVPINLLGGPNNGSITSQQIAGLAFEGTSRAYDELFAVAFNTTGELFSLPSGDRPVSLALGYEFRRQNGAQIADPIAGSGDSADFNFQSTQGHYTANEAYGELSIPLLANVPGVRNLEASVAGRYVNYSTFGGNWTYKFGARYTPVSDLTVRGTYSTAFRAPSINELFLGQSETAPNATDPCADLSTVSTAVKNQCIATGVPATGSGDRGQQQLARQGGNPNLKAETAKIFTAGVVVEPRAVRNLSITLDYYHIDVDDLVGTIGVPAILAGCYPTNGATPANCDLITRAPGSGRILFITDTNHNVGSQSTAGIDFAVRYAIPTPVGRFGLGLDGTWLEHFDRSQVIGTTLQTINGKGNFDLGALPQWKFNVGATWRFGGWSAAALARYVGTFKECSTPPPDLSSSGGLCYAAPNLPARQVGHNWTVDLNASYTLLSGIGKTLLLVGVNNVFDQAPQYVYAAPLANSDPNTYDFLGRYVYSRLQHTF